MGALAASADASNDLAPSRPPKPLAKAKAAHPSVFKDQRSSLMECPVKSVTGANHPHPKISAMTR